MGQVRAVKKRQNTLVRPRPVTVPEPTDYSVRLEAARELLRKKGRTLCIEPPPRTGPANAPFQVVG